MNQACTHYSSYRPYSSHPLPRRRRKEPSPIISLGKDGRLAYDADERGNRVPDFSRCGYAGGDRAIPEAPVRVVVEPETRRQHRAHPERDRLRRRPARRTPTACAARCCCSKAGMKSSAVCGSPTPVSCCAARAWAKTEPCSSPPVSTGARSSASSGRNDRANRPRPDLAKSR